MVTEGSSLADVGTDHGYIPIALVQTGKVSRAIAMDINKGPLERAAFISGNSIWKTGLPHDFLTE